MTDTETKDSKEEEIPNYKPNSIKCDILLVTSSMQNQNGLRVNDYLRYSHFCRKKINKLRKLFKLTQGKRKYQKNEITADKITDNKILLIVILECERNWAYGMYHKQELTELGTDIKRLRYQIMRKFKRSVLNAKKVLDLCEKIGDSQTQLEAKAYFAFINSNYLIFKREYNEALTLLKNASNIYDKISQLKDTIESIEYKDKINSMKTSMRLCIYNLTKEQDEIIDEETFLKNVDNIDEIEITEKIEEIKKKNQEKPINNEDEFEIKYHGMNIPIKNEALKKTLLKMNELKDKILKENDLNKKVIIFQDYFNKIDEANKITKKEKSEQGNKPTENFAKIYQSLLSYIENLRLIAYIEKNNHFIQEYEKDFENIETITNIFEKDNIKLKYKPQEIMKLYDNLIEYENQLINLEKENPDQKYLIDHNFKEKIYSLCKIYYVGLFYILNKKYNEAHTLMFHSIDKIKEVNEFFENHKLNNVSSLKELKDNVNSIEKMCIFIINMTYSKIQQNKNLNDAKLKNKNNKDKDSMEIDTNKKEKKIKYNPYLYDTIINEGKTNLTKEQYSTMEKYVTLPYNDFMQVTKENTFNNYTHIMQIPMNTELISPKPIVYDLIYEKLEYPDLKDKTKTQSKSLMGRAFGYFWGS